MSDGSSFQGHPSQSRSRPTSGGGTSRDGGAPSGKASGSGSSTGKSSSDSHHHHHHHHYTYEERLCRAWRSMASSIVNSFQKAEKAAKENTRESLKELDESVVTFIRQRMEVHRWISLVEAKLQGKAQEREALENYIHSKPRLGKRKRVDEVGVGGDNALLSPTTQQSGTIDAATRETTSASTAASSLP